MIDKKHIHHDKIIEWAADTSVVWQYKGEGESELLWRDCAKKPAWNTTTNYRRKNRWFDMEQEWLAKGKPPVEMLEYADAWVDCNPFWTEEEEYRFKEVSRHAALKAEWEAKGRPERQYKQESEGVTEWSNIVYSAYDWMECCEYRIKPTPHHNADVLLALAEDGSLKINIEVTGNQYKFTYSGL